MQPKTKKTIYIVIGVVVAVVLILALWLKFTNVAPFKPMIERQISDAASYEMSIDGEVDLKLIPLSLRITDMHLRNPAGFTETDLMYVPECRVGLKLMPLIGRNFVVKDIKLIGMTAQLERNRDRQANWDFGNDDDNRKPQIGQMILDLPFNNLVVENGRIVYRDAIGGSVFTMEEVELRAGPFSAPDNRLNFEFRAKAQRIPLNMQGYTTESLTQILHSNWPYAVQLHFINNSFGTSQ